jgi:hypothetical protein
MAKAEFGNGSASFFLRLQNIFKKVVLAYPLVVKFFEIHTLFLPFIGRGGLFL